MQDSVDSVFMSRAIELAARGAGYVAPNPLVGCVIVWKDRIIGEGFHASFGGPHAEVNAISAVNDSQLLRESTLYVTLEPCAHFGKTPPCSNLIIEKGIPRVVIGCSDPFSAVNGKGIEQLRNSGVEVATDVMSRECRFLNRRFFTFHEKKRPYVVLKWAQSINGFMDIDRTDGRRGSFMISHPDTQLHVHRWRSEEAAILVGKNTVLCDNPSLTVRRVEGKNPIRIVLSSEAFNTSGLLISANDAPTIIINDAINRKDGHVRYIACGSCADIGAVLERMHEENILSVLVEGGSKVLQSFLSSGLWDEARVIVSDNSLEKGMQAPLITNQVEFEERSATDTIRFYRNKS